MKYYNINKLKKNDDIHIIFGSRKAGQTYKVIENTKLEIIKRIMKLDKVNDNLENIKSYSELMNLSLEDLEYLYKLKKEF